jgi:hypothetical protein
MKAQIKGKNALVICLAVLIVPTAISIVVVRQSAKVRQQETKPDVHVLPQVTSIVKDLEVVNATLLDEKKEPAGVAVEILNNSDLAVTSVTLSSGENGITANGLVDEDNPIVIIKPHGTYTMRMSFGTMMANFPLVINGVTFSDGSEDGDKFILDEMHAVRARDRANRAAQKGGNQ